MLPKEIQPGCLFAEPPGNWLERKLASIQKARTWHWGILIAPTVDNDWITSEDLDKGTAISRLNGKHAFVYSIKGLLSVNPMDIIAIHSEYGSLPYNWSVTALVIIWWLIKHYLGIVIPSVIHDKPANCEEWCVLVAAMLNAKIIPDNAYPTQYNLENSPFLEYVGEVNKV